jgi:hypothetical protein
MPALTPEVNLRIRCKADLTGGCFLCMGALRKLGVPPKIHLPESAYAPTMCSAKRTLLGPFGCP